MSAFDNATLMITGGTGSFGSTVLKHFLDSDLKEIRIFSRDEKKQYIHKCYIFSIIVFCKVNHNPERISSLS